MSTTPPLEFITATGLANLTIEQQRRSIFVSQISPNANLKKVSDFFSFCGNIQTIVQDRDPLDAEKQIAVVVFEEEGSASTAMLLGQAIIVDTPIIVHQYVHPVQPSAFSTNPNINTQPPTAKPPAGRSATSVVASIVAAGYIKSQELIHEITGQAKKLDESIHITDNANKVYDQALQKSKSIDNDLHITQKVTQLKQQTVTQAKQIDEKYHLTEKAQQVKEKAKELSTKVYEMEPVKKSVELVEAGWNSMVGMWKNFTTETKEEIEKQKQTSTSNPSNIQNETNVLNNNNQPIINPDGQVQSPDQQQQSSSLQQENIPKEQQFQSVYPSVVSSEPTVNNNNNISDPPTTTTTTTISSDQQNVYYPTGQDPTSN